MKQCAVTDNLERTLPSFLGTVFVVSNIRPSFRMGIFFYTFRKCNVIELSTCRPTLLQDPLTQLMVYHPTNPTS